MLASCSSSACGSAVRLGPPRQSVGVSPSRGGACGAGWALRRGRGSVGVRAVSSPEVDFPGATEAEVAAYAYRFCSTGVPTWPDGTPLNPQRGICYLENSSWTDFEAGISAAPVHWRPTDESAGGNGLVEQRSSDVITAGETFTLYYNPRGKCTTPLDLAPGADPEAAPVEACDVFFYAAFNGPLMTGSGLPQMKPLPNRPASSPIYAVSVTAPRHGVWMQFGFSNGSEWDEGYAIPFRTPEEFTKPYPRTSEFYKKGLAQELLELTENNIFPGMGLNNPDRCVIPKYGASCPINVVDGCMDPGSPNFDPLATVSLDGSCDIN